MRVSAKKQNADNTGTGNPDNPDWVMAHPFYAICAIANFGLVSFYKPCLLLICFYHIIAVTQPADVYSELILCNGLHIYQWGYISAQCIKYHDI